MNTLYGRGTKSQAKNGIGPPNSTACKNKGEGEENKEKVFNQLRKRIPKKEESFPVRSEG